MIAFFLWLWLALALVALFLITGLELDKEFDKKFGNKGGPYLVAVVFGAWIAAIPTAVICAWRAL